MPGRQATSACPSHEASDERCCDAAESNHNAVRATVRAWVHGRMETYTNDVHLDSLQHTVTSLAQAVYRRYMSTYYRHGGVGSCDAAADFAPLVLPRDAVTIPEVICHFW